MSLASSLIARFLPLPLPVIKAMPDHVRNSPLNMDLLMFQMESHRQQKSAAVNNSPYIRAVGEKT